MTGLLEMMAVMAPWVVAIGDASFGATESSLTVGKEVGSGRVVEGWVGGVLPGLELEGVFATELESVFAMEPEDGGTEEVRIGDGDKVGVEVTVAGGLVIVVLFGF